MVLFVGGVQVGKILTSSESLYELAPELKDSATLFANTQIRTIGPEELLYVSQREFAVCSSQEESISILGTDDCTSCMAVIVRHPTTGVTGIGHLDSPMCVEGDGIPAIISRVQELSGCFDSGTLHMHLVGSFVDAGGYSAPLIKSVLECIGRHPVKIELVSCCIGGQNTVLRGSTAWPIVYGVGIDLKTGNIFPASYTDKGPDLALRGARHFTGNSCLLEIYDFLHNLLRIGPFHYTPMRNAQVMLKQTDEYILTRMSTTPDVEPVGFVDSIRSALQHLVIHPHPETVFHGGQPRYYRKDFNGQWIFITDPKELP